MSERDPRSSPLEGPRSVGAEPDCMDPPCEDAECPEPAADGSRTVQIEEDNLAALQQRAAVGELSAAIVHESRNIMTGVLSFAQVGRLKAASPDKAEHMFTLIEREALRCMDLFTQVLQSIRREVAPPVGAVACDAAEVLEAVRMLTEHKLGMNRVKLRIAADSQLPLVGMARSELIQVLLNLVLNAAAVVGDEGQVAIAATSAGGEVTIAVADSGPGVPAELRERVFELYFTTKGKDGGGLGLAISRELVEAVGGSLTLDDAPGGACFRVRVPAARTGGDG